MLEEAVYIYATTVTLFYLQEKHKPTDRKHMNAKLLERCEF